jgi:hypothetical protein
MRPLEEPQALPPARSLQVRPDNGKRRMHADQHLYQFGAAWVVHARRGGIAKLTACGTS